MDGTSTPKDTPILQTPEKIDYDAEYLERFTKLKADAQAKGFRYIHPSRAGIGWKIHLAVADIPEDPLTSQIADFLNSKRLKFKIGSGGTTENGKGMTIYIGDRDTMENYAEELDQLFGKELPESRGDALESDMQVSGNVWARFENDQDTAINFVEVPDRLMGTIREAKYIHYGPRGVPALRADALAGSPGNSRPDKVNSQEMREHAVTALTQDYGAFFTGTRNSPI